MTRRKSDVLIEGDAVFLDPENVGSAVRWNCSTFRKNGRRFDFTVSLSDCNRTIEWSAWGADGFATAAKKVRAARDQFTKILGALYRAEEHFNSIAPRKRRKK